MVAADTPLLAVVATEVDARQVAIIAIVGRPDLLADLPLDAALRHAAVERRLSTATTIPQERDVLTSVRGVGRRLRGDQEALVRSGKE